MKHETPTPCFKNRTYQQRLPRIRPRKKRYACKHNISSQKKQRFCKGNMSEYQDFPPLKSFIRVLKSCPKSAFLYLQIWKMRDEDLRVDVHKEDVRRHFFMSPTLFLNMLIPLGALALLSLSERPDKIQIRLSGAHLNE